MWIYAVIAVVTVLVVFALIKILGKKPQTADPAGSSDVSLTVSVPSTEQSGASEGAESSDENDAESKDETSKAQSGEQSDSGSGGGSSQSPSSSKSNGDYINYTVSGAAEADQWYLQIASVAHPLPEGFVQPSTTVIDDIGREIDSRIVGAYWDLVNAAKADGLNIYPISGFRPHSTQVSLFNARVEQARNDGYADPEAEAAVMWQSREQVSTSLVLRLISTAWTKAISVTRPRLSGLPLTVPNTDLSFAIPRTRNR